MTNIELQKIVDQQDKKRIDYPAIPLINEESEFRDLESSPGPSLTSGISDDNIDKELKSDIFILIPNDNCL